jgi:hypothetical protein
MREIPGLSFIRRKQVDLASRAFDRRLLRDGEFWLFILGVNNSGTTILANLLETHPQIRSLPGEGHKLTKAFPRPDLLGVGRLWSSRLETFRWGLEHDPAPALQAKRDWATLYPNRPGILLEKSPPNAVRSRWLQRNFTPSRFLAIVRNPYAVCEGIRRRKAYSIEQAAAHWTTANLCLLDDFEHLEQKFMIRYETLTEQPQRTFAEVADFLGLQTPFDVDGFMHVQAHSLQGTTAGLKNLNGPSIERLSRSDIDTINTTCGDLMGRLGYSRL